MEAFSSIADLLIRVDNVDNSENTPTVLSFCSGYGGIERGLDIAGFKHRVITYVEIEAYAAANLVAKMETNKLDAAPIYTNLKTFPSEIFRDKVSLITGGYPCQPFSLASANRKGTKDPRHLWSYFREHIKTIRPVWCFFENVEGHLSLGLRQVIEDLESMGYASTFGIFSASEVGAPHQRKRVYILGNSQNNRCEWWSENIKRERSENISERSDKDLRCQSQRSGQVLADSKGRTSNSQWPSEPRLGRVVDGCPDRVDRIRMLGNGVVPQTAAKAWVILNNKLLEQNETRCG